MLETTLKMLEFPTSIPIFLVCTDGDMEETAQEYELDAFYQVDSLDESDIELPIKDLVRMLKCKPVDGQLREDSSTSSLALSEPEKKDKVDFAQLTIQVAIVGVDNTGKKCLVNRWIEKEFRYEDVMYDVGTL